MPGVLCEKLSVQCSTALFNGQGLSLYWAGIFIEPARAKRGDRRGNRGHGRVRVIPYLCKAILDPHSRNTCALSYNSQV